jgi:hypothetical protein
LHWHFPSDVLGGFLVAWTYVLLALATLNGVEQRWPSHRQDAPSRPSDGLPALGLAAAAVAGAAVFALVRPDAVVRYTAGHTTFVMVAALVGGLALTLAVLLAAGLRAPRTPTRRPRAEARLSERG